MKRRAGSGGISSALSNKIIGELQPIALSILGKCIEKNPTSTTDQHIASIANGVMAFWSTIMNGGHPDHGMNAAMTIAEELPGIASIANIASSKIRDPNKQLDATVNSAADLLKRATTSALQGAASETKNAVGNYIEDFAKLFSHSVAKRKGSSFSSSRKSGRGAIGTSTFTVGWLNPPLSGGFDFLGTLATLATAALAKAGVKKGIEWFNPPPAPSPLRSIDYSSVRHLLGDAPFPKMDEAATQRAQYRLSATYNPYSRRRKATKRGFRGGDNIFNTTGFNSTGFTGFNATDTNSTGFYESVTNSTDVNQMQDPNLTAQDAPDLGFFGNLAYYHPNIANVGLTLLYPLIRHLALPALGLGIQKFHNWQKKTYPNAPTTWVGNKIEGALTAIGEKFKEPEYKLGLQKIGQLADLVIPAATQDYFVHLGQRKKFEHDVKERNKKVEYALEKAKKQKESDQQKIDIANANIDSENAKTIFDMNERAEQAELRNRNRLTAHNERLEEWWRVNGPILEYNEEVDKLAKQIHDQLDAAEQYRQSPLGKVFRTLRSVLDIGKAVGEDIIMATGVKNAWVEGGVKAALKAVPTYGAYAQAVSKIGKQADKLWDSVGAYEDELEAQKRFIRGEIDRLEASLDSNDPNIDRDDVIKKIRGFSDYATNLARSDLFLQKEKAQMASGWSDGLYEDNVKALEGLQNMKKIWWDQTPGIVPSEKEIAFSMKQKTDPMPIMEQYEYVPPRYDENNKTHKAMMKQHLPDAIDVLPEYIPEVQAPIESNPNMMRAAALVPQVLMQQVPKAPKPDIPAYIASMPTAVNAGPSGSSRPLNTVVVPAFKQNKMFSILPLAGTALRRFGQVSTPYVFPAAAVPKEDEEIRRPQAKKRRPGTRVPSRL